jgi:hypothetical protein
LVVFTIRGFNNLTGPDKSPDIRYTDQVARVWEIAGLKEIAVLKGHRTGRAACGHVLGRRHGPRLEHPAPPGLRARPEYRPPGASLWPLDLLPIALSRKPRELTAEECSRFAVPTDPAPPGQ